MLKTADTSKRATTTTKVLVVEDNPVERQLVCKILRNNDLDVLAVDCGGIVQESFDCYQPDILLLDALLPDIDGFEVCKKLRAHPNGKYVPVIMLTGLDDVDSINLAYEVGATDFFSKPVNHGLLIHRIRYLLRARETTEALRLSQQSLISAQHLAQLGSWEVDIVRKRLVISPQLQKLLQLEVTGLDLGTMEALNSPIIQRCHPADRAIFIAAVQRVNEQAEESRFECRFVLDDGRELYMDTHLGLISRSDYSDVHMLGVMMDITARKHSEQEILRLAYFDRLTELPNRSLFELFLDEVIPQSHMQGLSVAVLALDLDLFNRVNNSMGHSAGNAILEQLTTRMVELTKALSVREVLEEVASTGRLVNAHRGELLARLAADNFVVAVPEVTRGDQQAIMLAKRLKSLFEQPFVYRGQELFVTASIGIAYSESGGTLPEAILQQADLALHEAKSQGRNEICEYTGELVTKASNHLSIQNELKKALLQGELQLFYQPKVSTVDNSVVGFEALIRWFHPDKGMIPPDKFITVAEETGQIVEIGEWVLETACRENMALIEQGLADVRVAVNVSARQFKERNFVEVVECILARTGLPPSALELEITEGILMSNAAAEQMVAELRNLGVSIALDDFGTGYSSLSYISRFPIDVIKIDRSFVQDIHHKPQQAAIVSGVTTISHSLNFIVVAEGVETEKEFALIRDLGCDQVQGYFFSRPQPMHDLSNWLNSHQIRLQKVGSAN